MKKSNYLKSVFIVFFSIFGNPLYQIISFICCHQLGYYAKISTNVTQIEKAPYFIFLLLIFLLRVIIYTLIFHFLSQLKPFKNPSTLFIRFINCHLYQFFGLITLLIWISELEGNIIGFLVVPLSLIIGIPLSALTVLKIRKLTKNVLQETV